MKTGSIHCPADARPFNLRASVEGGHTFRWQRDYGAGEMYDDTALPAYVTVLPATETESGSPEVVRLRQSGDRLYWQAEYDMTEVLIDHLRLDDELDSITKTFPDGPLMSRAVDEIMGLRLPNDPIFPTLIAFICSSQMRVPRIHQMQVALAETFGTPVEFDELTYHAFPTPSQLAAASEDDLRALKLGYRARYVKDTASLIHTEDIDLSQAIDLSYDEAVDFLQQFMGVGAKVADCVALYACRHLEAVPVDTWIQKVLESEYPSLVDSSYNETARAARSHFGPYAGYAQAYLFAAARDGL